MDTNNKKVNLQNLVTKWAIKKLKDNKNAIAIVYGAGVGDKFIPDNFLTLCYNKKDLEEATLNMKKRLSPRSSSEVQVLYRKDLEDIIKEKKIPVMENIDNMDDEIVYIDDHCIDDYIEKDIYQHKNLDHILDELGIDETNKLSKTSPMFILPNGNIIDIKKANSQIGINSRGYDTHQDFLYNIFKKLFQNKYGEDGVELNLMYGIDGYQIDEWQMDIFTEKYKLIRINPGNNMVEDRFYCVLPRNSRPTESQFNTLRDFFDLAYEMNKNEILVVTTYESQYKKYSLIDNTADDIVKKCKKFYGSNSLVEHKAITFGDLDYAKKTDTQDMMPGRGSGHFGTGFYFVGKDGPYGIKDNKLVYDYNEKRPVYEIDLDKYNLYKPQSNSKAYELFDALRNINRNFKPNIDYSFDENKEEEIKNELYKLGSDLDDPYEYLDSENINLEDNINLDELDESLTQKEFNDKYKQEVFNFIDKYGLKKYMWVNEYDIENDIKNHRLGKIDDDIRKGIHNKVYSIYELNMSIKELSKIFNITFDKIVNILTEVSKQNNNESLSTKFMKSLGYEGVDVTALNHDAEGLSGLDNFAYGSVVYDLKPNTYKRIMEPRK